jgi:hypothetical protein
MGWTHIVIHHSADQDDPWIDAEDYDQWHRDQGWRRIGYNWVVELIDDSYHAVMGRPLFMKGSHAGPRWNARAIGVCFAGDFMKGAPPIEQLIVGAELVAGLCTALGISPSNILRHSETRPTTCPGDHFPFGSFIRMVRGFVEGAEVDLNA